MHNATTWTFPITLRRNGVRWNRSNPGTPRGWQPLPATGSSGSCA